MPPKKKESKKVESKEPAIEAAPSPTPAKEPEVYLAVCRGCGVQVAVYGTITYDGVGYCTLECYSKHTTC